MRTTGGPPTESRLITREIRVSLFNSATEAVRPAIDELMREGYRVVSVVPSYGGRRGKWIWGALVLGGLAMFVLVFARVLFGPPGPSLWDLGPLVVGGLVFAAGLFLARETTWVIYAERVDGDARKSIGA